MRTVAAAGILMALLPVAARGSSPTALRLPEKDLTAEPYKYLTTTAELPADIRQGLARQLEQKELLMADAGMPFNSANAGADRAMPSHRLIVAAVGPKYSVVHFERGGVALTRWVIIFERATEGLNVLWHGVINELYREPREFAQAIRTGRLWKPPAKPAEP